MTLFKNVAFWAAKQNPKFRSDLADRPFSKVVRFGTQGKTRFSESDLGRRISKYVGAECEIRGSDQIGKSTFQLEPKKCSS